MNGRGWAKWFGSADAGGTPENDEESSGWLAAQIVYGDEA